MKFYLFTILIVFYFASLSIGQDNNLDQNKTEVPKLKTQSLRIETSVELFPNPADEYLNIFLVNNSRLKNVEVEMFNIIGNRVDFELEQVASNKFKANVKELKSGYYLVIVKDPVVRFNKAYKFRKQ